MSTVPRTEYAIKATLDKGSLSAMEELGTVLKTIYLRMKKEGYKIVDGQMVKINENEKSA